MVSIDTNVWFGLQRDGRFQWQAADASGLQTNQQSSGPSIVLPSPPQGS